MPRILNTVHPVKRGQFHAEFAGKELNLFFNIGGR